jgi:hypothetical protein
MLKGVALIVDMHGDGKRCGIMMLAEKQNLSVVTRCACMKYAMSDLFTCNEG